MAGAFNAAADAIAAALEPRVTVIRHWERYAGQDLARMRELVRSRGTSAFVRAVGAQAAGVEGPASADCAELAIQIAVAAPAAAQNTAMENAWTAVWACYGALAGTQGGMAWLLEPLRFVAAEIEEQTADCAVASLTMAAHADLAELTDEGTPWDPADPVPPETGLETIADLDRITVWQAAAGFARRFMAGAALKAMIAALGIPPGGTLGQVLAKASDADRDVEWIEPPATSGNIDGGRADEVYGGLAIIDGGMA